MKHLKAKLMATVMSLILATLMLTSASFAWFTISTAPEISNVTTKMTSNNNLEIMLDKGYAAGADGADNAARTIGTNTTPADVDTNAERNYYWGNLVDLDGYFNATSGSLKDMLLKPVVATEASGAITFATPLFAKDGRIDGSSPLTGDTTADGVTTYDIASGTNPYAFSMEFWLRTNAAPASEGGTIPVSLLTAAGTSRGDTDGETGDGSWISSDKVTVKISDGSNIYNVTLGEKDASSGHFPINGMVTQAATPADATINLTQNVAKKVTVYVYMDGANMTNADFAATATDVAMNIQFTNASVTAANAMQVAETAKYGRGYTPST